MKILLTGSGGFTGTFFKNFLSGEKAEIFTMGTKKFTNERHFQISQNFRIEEIKKIILNISPDFIFHLAGSPKGNSENFLYDLNFKFAKNIILSSKALGKEVRIILIGSAAEYGIVKPSDLPIKETFKPSTKQELKNAVNEWCINNNEAMINYGNINKWDTSLITDMSYLFQHKKEFNDDISAWNVNNVTNMKGMFLCATSFNQPLDSWDVRRVTTMAGMFVNATSFNQPLDSWNVRRVTTMKGMFYGAKSFNQSLDFWDVSNVTNMKFMFHNTDSLLIWVKCFLKQNLLTSH